MTANEIPSASAAHAEEAVPEQAGRRQVRIGILVLSGLIATIYLLFLLTDPATFRGRYKINTTVDNVMGLRKGDPVQMRGVTIGRVHDFELGGQGEEVVIVLEVEDQWLIPEGSSTQLVTPALMAPRTVEILPGPGPGTLGRGDTMPGVAVRGLLDDTETLGEKGQIALDRIAELLSPKNLDAISGSAEGLNTVLSEISELVETERQNLSELIESFRQAADGLAEMTGDSAGFRGDLDGAVAKADSLMDRLYVASEGVTGAAGSLQSILMRLENGEGTLGRLLASDSLYTNLQGTVQSARLLMDDFRENPDRYMPKLSIF